ncbi:MAG: adenylyltransferase/cytidyltransferase family protein [Chloroflexi bacterium]|nr:adenylyltransferase/cytidyltransferase family protein [Chloroflexota bacterium]
MNPSSKLLSPAAAAQLPGCRVFTNGIFDILHVGHARYLQAARALGDCLIVGLNSDASTRALKGERHPIVPQAERAELLAALACVDAVVIFEDVTAEKIVAAIRPEIYVKGGDYALGTPGVKAPPEAAVVAAYGGRIEFIPFVAGKSTTNIVETILQRYGA